MRVRSAEEIKASLKVTAPNQAVSVVRHHVGPPPILANVRRTFSAGSYEVTFTFRKPDIIDAAWNKKPSLSEGRCCSLPDLVTLS